MTKVEHGERCLGGLLWVKEGVWSIYIVWNWSVVERQETGEPSSAAELKRQSLVRGCLSGCLRVLQLSALGRRQEALCVQVQAGGPVSACS